MIWTGSGHTAGNRSRTQVREESAIRGKDPTCLTEASDEGLHGYIILLTFSQPSNNQHIRQVSKEAEASDKYAGGVSYGPE